MRIDSSEASTAGELRNLEDLARLYEVEYWSLLRVAQLATGSPQLAEEAVHEAFISVYDRRDSIEQPGAYLRRVVLNNCYSMHRRRTLERKKIEAMGHRASDNEICLPPEFDEVWQSLARWGPADDEADPGRAMLGLALGAAVWAVGMLPRWLVDEYRAAR